MRLGVDEAGVTELIAVVEHTRCLVVVAAALPSGMAVPGLWRAIARNAHHLESTWRKEQVVMAPGVLSALDKRRVALAVAMSGRSRYMIEYEGALVRSAGDDDTAVLEVL